MHKCIRTSMMVNEHMIAAAGACRVRNPYYARQIDELRIDINRGDATLQSLRLLVWELDPNRRNYYSSGFETDRKIWKGAFAIALVSTVIGGVLGFLGKESAAEWIMYLGAGLPIGGVFLRSLATQIRFRSTVEPELTEAHGFLNMAMNEIMR